MIIKTMQAESFPEEYSALVGKKELPKKSKLLGLRPRLDEDGLMRCDGRLRYADYLPYDVRYPVILPRRNWVTKLIVKHYHEQRKYVAGTNHTLSALSTRFWVIAGQEEICQWEKECAECRQQKAKSASQVMAPLPNIRLKMPLRAFADVAVDYAGPFVPIQGRAAHFGGVHESMIKAAKRAIYAILKNADITDEELLTAVTGAEALINSRPITYQSANPDDVTPLTSNHFLHGQIGQIG
ncbi:uncharacterized protein [Ptychodera flava]|uniref:uncharacterized protein n=1 Tax=Ptychodera flava TaxID=63121 RepID=UPI00396A9680